MMNIPDRKKVIKVKEKNYTLQVNTGSFIDIELTKVRLTDGQYNQLSKSSEGLMAKFHIDMIAAFTVLSPDLKKDLSIGSFSELDPVDGKYLLDIYLKEVMPWLNDWIVFQNKMFGESEEGTNKEE